MAAQQGAALVIGDGPRQVALAGFEAAHDRLKLGQRRFEAQGCRWCNALHHFRLFTTLPQSSIIRRGTKPKHHPEVTLLSRSGNENQPGSTRLARASTAWNST